METFGKQSPAPANRVVILGAGGMGLLAADLCHATGQELVGFLDNRKPPGTCLYGNPVLGPFDLLEKDAALRDTCRFLVAVSDARLRRDWIGRIAGAGGRMITLVHPSVSCSPWARLGEGIMISPFSTLYPGAEIGDGCLIQGHCVVGPEVTVMPVCFLGESSMYGSGSRIGADSFIGAGAFIRPGLSIGQGCVIGANSTVVRDIPSFKVAVGSPTRILRDNVDLHPAHAEQNPDNQ